VTSQANRERRHFAARDLEVREELDGVGTLVGHASTFSQPYELWDGVREVVRPGAFRRAIEDGADVFALAHHDAGQILGRRSSGTLRVSEDARGLAVEIGLPDTTLGRDLATLVGRGDLSAMSFGFAVRSERWTLEDDGSELRELLDLELYEVSAVAWPANPNTDLALRSLEQHRAERSRVEMTARHAELRRALLRPGLPRVR